MAKMTLVNIMDVFTTYVTIHSFFYDFLVYLCNKLPDAA